MTSFRFHPKTPSFSMSHHTSSPSPPSVSSSTTPPSSSIDELDEVEALIQKWNPETSAYAKVTSLFYEDKTEAMHYINCVNHLHKTMHSLITQNPSSQKLILAHNLMQIAMKRLQKEFYQILSMNRAHLDSESVSTISSRTSVSSDTSYNDNDDGTPEEDVHAAGDSISEVEHVSSVAMADLRSIADCMVSNGYAKECVSVYKTMRKSIVDEGIYRMNVEELSSSRVKKIDWEVLDLKIKSWLEAVKISVRTLFSGERILCDHVFGAWQSIREVCFSEISRKGATILFGFPELVAKTKKFPQEKIFRVLDMYAAIVALLPEIESIFSFDSTAAIQSQAFNSLLRLAESARMILSDFESTIQKDCSKLPANFAGVHSLTTQTMNCLSSLADYSNVLSEIFLNMPPPPKSPSPNPYLYSPESDDTTATVTVFSEWMAWMILVLLCKIDGKSKHRKDVSLSYLFLANNLRHVVAKVRASNLQNVLGDDWVVKHKAKVKWLVANYERVAWGEVLSSLPENPSAVTSPAEAKVVFGNFNFEFEKAYRKQNAFVVPEPKFRDEIKASLSRKITTIYRQVYDSHRITVGSVWEMREYVSFTPEDVESYMVNLFFVGRTSSGGGTNCLFVKKK